MTGSSRIVRRAGVGLALLLGLAGCVTPADLDRLDQGLSQKLDRGQAKTQEAVVAALRAEMGGVREDMNQFRASVENRMNELRGEVDAIRSAQAKRQDELARSLDVVRTTLETEVVGLRQLVETLKADTKAALAQMEVGQAMQQKLLTTARSDQALLKEAVTEHAAATAQEFVRLQTMADKTAGQVQGLQAAVAALNASLQQLSPALVGLQGDMQALSQTMLGTYKLEEAALRVRLKALEEGIKQLEPAATARDAAGGPPKPGGKP